MKSSYKDILSRIHESPIWWDENGVPRYTEFHPRFSCNSYADEVALILIECQGCGVNFKVSVSSDKFSGVLLESKSLSDQTPRLYYGDPPNLPCCPAGPTMTSVTRKIIEFWVQSKNINDHRLEWIRKPEFEVECEDDDP